MEDSGIASWKRGFRLRRRLRIAQRALSLCLLVCVAYLVWYQIDSRAVARKNKELQKIAQGALEEMTDVSYIDRQTENAESREGTAKTKAADNAEAAGAVQDAESEEAVSASGGTGFEALLQINPDLKGWISIPGTILSLPVVQGGDNDYYLDHDFYGEKDRHGTIFIDCEADLDAEAFNTVIYGHHMRDGSMFGVLKEYHREAFYQEHPSFFLTLPGEEREYEILAVVRNDIFEGNAAGFQYYDYKQITDEVAFSEYCRLLQEGSLYDTGVEAEITDQLVTLCTCDYGSEDQRLLVVGKKKEHDIDIDSK